MYLKKVGSRGVFVVSHLLMCLERLRKLQRFSVTIVAYPVEIRTGYLSYINLDREKNGFIV
jgi:hypothetical protein